MADGGKLSTAKMLRCRVRGMRDSAVFEARAFVDKFFEARRDFFGAKRRTGARPIYDCQNGTVRRAAYSLRA